MLPGHSGPFNQPAQGKVGNLPTVFPLRRRHAGLGLGQRFPVFLRKTGGGYLDRRVGSRVARHRAKVSDDEYASVFLGQQQFVDGLDPLS